MKKVIRLGLFWITTILSITQVNGQITFINPPGDTTATCTNLDPFPPDPETVHNCEGDVFIFISNFSDRVLSTDTCAFYEYTITRVFTATNNCADTTRHVQLISVIDTIGPVFMPPPAVTVNCNDLNDLNVTGGLPQMTGECGGPISTMYKDEIIAQRCGNTLTRTWTATDVCGNFTTGTQLITVEDDNPPSFVMSPRDISVMCSTTNNPYPIFNDWVRNLGYATYQDGCNQVDFFFAAVPGSYNLNDASSFPGEHPGGLNEPECGIVDGSVQFEAVEFVIVDDCGNAHMESATFFYVDDVFPTLGDCDFDITVNIDGADCTRNLTFDIPEAIDSCSLEDLEITFSDIQNITSDAQGDPDTIVNDVTIRLFGYGPELTYEEESFFEVNLFNIDADTSSEFFEIYDENGLILGTTPILSEECGDTTFLLGPIAKDTMELWSADGQILFSFKANISSDSPSNSINHICNSGLIEVNQTLIIQRAVDPVQRFFQIDENPLIPVDGISVIADFNAGAHVVKFLAEDCAGNVTFCAQRVTVFDNSPPQLNCAVNMQFESAIDGCEVPVSISEAAMVNNPCDEAINIQINIDGEMDSTINGLYSEIKDNLLYYPLGQSTISVVATDFSGNQSECSFAVEVVDNVFPNAVCDNIDAPAVAVQLESFKVSPFQLAGNSTDNCGIRNIVIENNQFSCFDLNQIVSRNVLVIDESDNVSSCVGTFNISDAPVPISYTAGICPQDSLKFFLNIPQRPEYEYDWDGPLGFSSVLAEPFIPEVQTVHEGQYFLTITNTQTGCESSGSIEVFIEDIKRPTLTTEEIGCTVIPHRLTSSLIEGEVIYNWYLYLEQGRSLLTQTEVPFVDITFDPGVYTVGVVMSNSKCESQGSNRITIEIRGQPEGAICTKLIEGCIGETLELCANDPEENFIVRWFGPNGFESNEIMPIVTDSFTSEFSGVYKLVFENNQCITDTLTTTVTSNSTPPVPEILGDTRYCTGEQIELASSKVKNGYIYVWESPSGTIRNNQPILRIPNAGTHFTGKWTLRIEDGPCVSKPSEPVDLDIEPNLNFTISPLATQCDGAQISLSTNAPSESIFEWTGPDGFQSNAFSPALLAVEGFYQATVTTLNGCTYTDEIFINTTIIPQIIGVTVSEESQCIERESTLTIIPKLSMAADVQYEWTGPNLTSQSSTLNVENFTFADNGIYTVKVLNGDCESEVFNFILSYIISPIKPTIDVDPIACIGDPLAIKTNKFNASAIYQWTTPAGMIETTENELFFESAEVSNSGEYSVQVMIGECTSPMSEQVNISVQENTFVPTISSSGQECIENEFKLFTDFSADLDIEWELPDGSFLVVDTLVLQLKQEDAGDYRARTLSNGCPSDFSAIRKIDVLDPRIGITLSTDFMFSCNNDGADLEFCVDASVPTEGITFQWYLGDLLLGETAELCFDVNQLEVFAFGTNEIHLRFDYKGCIIPFDDPLFLEIENVRDIDVTAGEDQLFCIGEALIMNADEVNTSEFSAFWSVESGVEVDDIRDPMAEIMVLEDLDSTFAVWNVEHFECGVVYRDSVVLKQKTKPLPVIDTLIVEESQITFNPLENDVLITGNTYRLREVSDPRWGSASISGEAIIYQSDPKFIGGPITFTYTVCDNACEELCDEGEVVILYNIGSCKGNNVLTPNNDGANDRFIIPCVQEEILPENSLVILNELGNTIFEEAPYRNTWNGTFNGEPLPEGTYYYIFRKDNRASVIQGFISIER